MEKRAFQDDIPENSCYGCGPDEQGLRIKSYFVNPGSGFGSLDLKQVLAELVHQKGTRAGESGDP